jgi:hypothetical protein
MCVGIRHLKFSVICVTYADYIQCDYCGRRFNESAAERHIAFCKEQHERLPKKKPDQMTAAQKMAVRTQVRSRLILVFRHSEQIESLQVIHQQSVLTSKDFC